MGRPKQCYWLRWNNVVTKCEKFEAAVREIARRHALPRDYEDTEFLGTDPIPDLTLALDCPPSRQPAGPNYLELKIYPLEPAGERIYPSVVVAETYYRVCGDHQHPEPAGGHLQFDIIDGDWVPWLLNLSKDAQAKVALGNYPAGAFLQLRSSRPDPNGDEVADMQAVRMMIDFANAWGDRLRARWLAAGVQRIEIAY